MEKNDKFTRVLLVVLIVAVVILSYQIYQQRTEAKMYQENLKSYFQII